MIKFSHTQTYGWEASLRGMRNPMNSWEQSDSDWEFVEDPSIINPNDEVKWVIGKNDLTLMKKLAKAGSDHRKFMRQIFVSVDITAPLYWWKEFDTYKVGTVANSTSTMHTIHKKEFELDDFSHEHLIVEDDVNHIDMVGWLQKQIDILNEWRQTYLDVDDSPINAESRKKYWWQMIQLLPSSYNQKRTITLNYEVLRNMYHARKNHKLQEWHTFCGWIEGLPYSEIITEVKKNGESQE